MPPPAPHRTTIADILAETMSNWGVTHTFGMVGASNLGVGDALRRLEADGRMTYIGVRHEGSAAFAASAYAKLTGRPAACLAIAGPGATNLMTGLWDAKMDRAPVLAITGQVRTQVMGPGAFQEIDLASAFEPLARSTRARSARPAGRARIETSTPRRRPARSARHVAPGLRAGRGLKLLLREGVPRGARGT